jgi:hypothetical protein
MSPTDTPIRRFHSSGQRRPVQRFRRHVVLLTTALCSICILASSCGVPYDAGPRALPGLPQALSGPAAAPPTTTLSHGALANLFYIQNSRLYLFPNLLPKPLTISEVLSSLAGGPGPRAAASTGGPVENDIPVGSDLQKVGLAKGVVHVEAAKVFYDQQSTQAALELGQIVYSLVETKALGVLAVQFFLQGAPAAVVNASGQDVTGTVSEADYCLETVTGCPAQKTTKSAAPSSK